MSEFTVFIEELVTFRFDKYHAPDQKQVPKKIKSSGGSNPYKHLNQMLDFQLKQARLEEIRKKKEGK